MVHVYRREEGAAEVYERRNAAPVGSLDHPLYEPGWEDQGLEECRAYVYRAAEVTTRWVAGRWVVPAGEQSALSEPLFVDRHVVAEAPGVLAHDPVNRTVTLSWSLGADEEGLTTCAASHGSDEEADDFKLLSLQFYRADVAGYEEAVSGLMQIDLGHPETVYSAEVDAPDDEPH
jgi:hypothetical protein